MGSSGGESSRSTSAACLSSSSSAVSRRTRTSRMSSGSGLALIFNFDHFTRWSHHQLAVDRQGRKLDAKAPVTIGPRAAYLEPVSASSDSRTCDSKILFKLLRGFASRALSGQKNCAEKRVHALGAGVTRGARSVQRRRHRRSRRKKRSCPTRARRGAPRLQRCRRVLRDAKALRRATPESRPQQAPTRPREMRTAAAQSAS